MKCPSCSEHLVNLEELYSEYNDSEYIVTVIGSCPYCQKDWVWKEHFVFSETTDIHEEY